MEGNIAQLGQYIGAGLAAIGSGVAAVGVGNVAGNFLSGALRNPSAAAGQFTNAIV
ncbi:MAG TPA: F0F1 ATP synthase subunit C, partial [Paracoccus sp.]|nr:F0F1 ATP synthase subunit C [Paracoccus sp. (in: a-proteobacteria)]